MSNVVIKSKIVGISLSCLFMIGLTTGIQLSHVPTAHAQSDKPKPARKTKRVQTVSASNAKEFEKIGELFEENKDSQAKAILDKLSLKTDLNNFEKAYLANFLGVYYFEREQLNSALREFKKIVATPDGIPEGFYSQTFYTIAQVYFTQEDYRNALDYAQRWFKTTQDPPADAYMLLGQAYYMLKQYDKALPNVQKGIQKYIDVGSVPKEGWLNLLMSIYREKGQYKKMLPIAKQLVQHYPKRSYLLTLGGIYNELGEQDKMTAMYQAMYDQGLISSESEVITLASLLMNNDSAYKASTLIEKGLSQGVIKKTMKNYRMYSNALLISKEYEKSLSPLGQAAKLSKNGELYYQLGQSYIALNRWKDAEGAFVKAFNKGKLPNPGSSLITLGLVQVELKKFKKARDTFKRASKYEKSARGASQWIKYVDAEVLRLKELDKPVVIDVDSSV